MSGEAGGLSVVAISGSPSLQSKTALLADAILARLAADGIAVAHHRVASIPPEALTRADETDPVFRAMAAAVDAAHGIVIATPIYKASYSGLLKCFLDALPQFAFAGKAVLPVGTGGSIAHVLALDYALRPVLQSMGARHIVQSHFVAATSIGEDDGGFTVDEAAGAPLWEAVRHLAGALSNSPHMRHLGHPRPAAETSA